MEVALAKVCGEDDIITSISLEGLDASYKHPVQNAENFWNHISPHQIRSRLGENMWASYFTFTIVRNPWDRMASKYFYKKDTEPQNMKLSFHEWVKSGRFSNSKWYFRNGQPDFDFFLRFENLNNDYQQLCESLNLDINELPFAKKSARTIPYWEHYDDEAKEIVKQYFAQDIKHFNYEFGV